MTPTKAVSKRIEPDRIRLALDLSPMVAGHLDRISDALGVPKSQIVVQALLQALPELLARVDDLARKGKK